jgi:hypothetical protein
MIETVRGRGYRLIGSGQASQKGGEMDFKFRPFVALGLLLASSPASADDGYLSRFAVAWQGGGTANLNLYLPDFRVRCKLAPTRRPNSVRLTGRCRLSILPFLSNTIDTVLNFDPATDSYNGTYSVSGGKPAILAGRQHGDALDLDVTWPIKVNGHYKAKIYIENDGRSHFTLKTVDPLGVHGTPMTTSDLHFSPARPEKP